MLAFIKTELERIGIPYAFMRWNADVKHPYFIGEYSEVVTTNEDGYEEYSFILTGTTRGTWGELETAKNTIKNHFPSVGGLRGSTADGTVVVFYDNAFPIDTGEADLKRIQINLTIKKWRAIT